MFLVSNTWIPLPHLPLICCMTLGYLLTHLGLSIPKDKKKLKGYRATTTKQKWDWVISTITASEMCGSIAWLTSGENVTSHHCLRRPLVNRNKGGLSRHYMVGGDSRTWDVHRSGNNGLHCRGRSTSCWRYHFVPFWRQVSCFGRASCMGTCTV